MKIYTKTGDAGQTGLFGGARVDKDDVRVEAYGCVDEANASLGVASALSQVVEVKSWLEGIQADLFSLGAELACPSDHLDRLSMPRLGRTHVAALEALIDQMETELPQLQNFILPGGTPAAAALHQARTVVRRAERRVLTLSKTAPVKGEPLVYLNRLSDLLFVMARYENHRSKGTDVLWKTRSG